MRHLWIVLMAAVAFGWAPLLAQEAVFEASVSRNPVSAGEQFELSFALTNAGIGGGKNLRTPDFSSFSILSGPNQSTSMQFINGSVSSSVTYSYVLQPKDVGKFTIAAASVEAGGKTLTTEPIVVEVIKGSLGTPKKQPTVANDLNVQIGENLFLKAVVDKVHVIRGEQINLTFKLYMRVSVQNYSIDQNPTLIGFWSEEAENPRNVSLTTETINGKQYRVGVIRRLALFPTQSGTLEISPMEVQTVVQVQDKRLYDPFESFFRDPFGRTVNYKVRSEPLRITVDPLPAGAPLSFKGAVGRLAMSAKVDKQTTKTNEPISLKVTIAGTGNIKVLESPPVEFPVDFESYSPKVAENISRQGDVISGNKTFEYLLIPRYPGNKTIKPIVFSYFDLDKREYVSLSSPQIDLVVEQVAPGVGGSLVAVASREGVQMLSQDIRFIKVAGVALSRRGEQSYASPLFIGMVLLPVVGLVGALLFVRRREGELRDVAGYRNKRALRVAREGLKKARQLLGSDDKTLLFYTEVSGAIWKYLGDKLGIQQAEMSVERALGQIQARGVNGGLAGSLQSLLEECEMAKFAPTSLEGAAKQKTYDEAERIIVELERVLRSK